jgi:hypothetical protein
MDADIWVRQIQLRGSGRLRRQHPPTRPPGFSVPAVAGIANEHGTADVPAGDAELADPCVVLVDAAPVVGREPLEEEPPGPLDAAAAPVADPPEEITDVGTLNGSLPQLGAPRMKPVDGVQNVIPPGFPVVAPDGLDWVAGAAVTALPAPGLTCGGLT